MSNVKLEALVRRYVDAWNDPDAAHRQSELASIYTDNASIVTQNSVVSGADAVVGHIDDVFRRFVSSGRYTFSTGGVVAHHDGVLFRWEMRDEPSGELADAGMNFFRLAADGRIANDFQFTLGVESSIGTSAEVLR